MKDLKSLNRVLLKLSGEALAGEKKTGFDEATVLKVAEQVKKIVDDGMQVAIVIGGGNFWRGRTSENMERTKADQIGMLATVMNCIYVSDMFRHVGMKTKIKQPDSATTAERRWKRAAVRMTMVVKIHIMEEVIAETVLTVERVPIMMAEMGHTELMISRIITEETEPITAHIITEETELIMELTTGAQVRTSRMII